MKRLLTTLTILVFALFSLPLYAVVPTYVFSGWAEKGGCQVQTVAWLSTNKVQCSYPGATIDVYTDAAGTIHDTIYSTAAGASLVNPFIANNDGSFVFFSNTVIVYVKVTGGGSPSAYMRQFAGANSPSVGYITQATADGRYLQLTGGTLATPGTLTVGGVLTANSTSNLSAGLLTTNGILDLSGGGGIVTRTANGGLEVNPTSGTTATVWTATPTHIWHFGMEGGDNYVVVDGNSSTTRMSINSATGLTTLTGGLTVGSGTTTVGTLNAGAVSGTTGTFAGAVSGTTGTFSSNVSGANGTFTGTGSFTGNLTASANVGIGHAPTASRLYVGAGSAGANSEEIRVDSGSAAGGFGLLTFLRNAVWATEFGVSGNANSIINGDAAYDTDLASITKINLSANSGTSIQASLNNSGFFGIGPATAVTPLHVQGTGGVQGLFEYDGTHRTVIYHDNTNGYVGTITNTPFKVQTNGTTAATFDTSQNANFAGKVGINDASGNYPFSVKKAGTLIFGTISGGAVVSDAAGAKGVVIGYDGTAKEGVVAAYDPTGAGDARLALYDTDLGGTPFPSILLTGHGRVTFSSKMTSYNGIPCEATFTGCISPVVGVQSFTGLVAATGPTTLYTTTAAVAHRVCWTQMITRAATTSSSLLTTIGWTNVAGVAKASTYWTDVSAGTTGTTADAGNTLGSERGNCFVSYMASGSVITITTTYSTTGATTMQYNLTTSVVNIGG